MTFHLSRSRTVETFDKSLQEVGSIVLNLLLVRLPSLLLRRLLITAPNRGRSSIPTWLSYKTAAWATQPDASFHISSAFLRRSRRLALLSSTAVMGNEQNRCMTSRRLGWSTIRPTAQARTRTQSCATGMKKTTPKTHTIGPGLESYSSLRT